MTLLGPLLRPEAVGCDILWWLPLRSALPTLGLAAATKRAHTVASGPSHPYGWSLPEPKVPCRFWNPRLVEPVPCFRLGGPFRLLGSP